MKHYPFQEQRAQPRYAVAYTSVNTIEDQLQKTQIITNITINP